VLVNAPVVLLVDDEPEALEGMASVLLQEPYEIRTAQTGRDALSVLETTNVLVIVSDQKMPIMEGSELLAIVRRDFPAVMRILLTGHASVRSAVDAINEGAVYRYLLKPVPAEDLRRVIREAIEDRTFVDLREEVFDGARRQYEAMVRLTLGDMGAASTRVERRAHAVPPAVGPGADWSRLSRRERDIVRLLQDGNDAKAIARSLDLSTHTVRNHLKAVYRKLRVSSQLELVSRLSRRT
jgi:DNA-binding NarL/FixJ family response regulator